MHILIDILDKIVFYVIKRHPLIYLFFYAIKTPLSWLPIYQYIFFFLFGKEPIYQYISFIYIYQSLYAYTNIQLWEWDHITMKNAKHQ